MRRELTWENGKPQIFERPIEPVTPRQARLAMHATPHGQGTLLQAVQSAIAASNNPALQIAWEYAVEWTRDAPEIAQIGAALGLTAYEIDALFARAKTL
jgi:hypothetical protein